MKQETFDIPAYKFFIGIEEDEAFFVDDNHYATNIVESLNSGRCNLIPWENLDGLTLRETLVLIKRSGFCFLCMSTWKNEGVVYSDVYFDCTLAPNYALKHLDEQVDKIIEKEMELTYSRSSEQKKKVFRCFFERYQENNYQNTMEKVKKLGNKN